MQVESAICVQGEDKKLGETLTHKALGHGPGNVDIGTRSDSVAGCLIVPAGAAPARVFARPKKREGVFFTDITLVEVLVQEARKATARMYEVLDVAYVEPDGDFESYLVGKTK